MQYSDEQQRGSASGCRFGDLLQQEDVLAAVPRRVFEIFSKLVDDQQEPTGAVGGDELREQLDPDGSFPGRRFKPLPRPNGEVGIRRPGVEQGAQQCRHERRTFGLHQQRKQRLRPPQIPLAELGGLLVLGLSDGEHVRQEHREGGFAASVGAGDCPRACATASSELSQDLPGNLQQRRCRQIIAGIVGCAPVMGKVHGTVETPAHPHESGKRLGS